MPKIIIVLTSQGGTSGSSYEGYRGRCSGHQGNDTEGLTIVLSEMAMAAVSWQEIHEDVIMGSSPILTILDTMASGVFLVNNKGTIVFWNQAAEIITGYSREEIIGRACGELPGEVCKDGGCVHGIAKCSLFNDEQKIERECRLIGKDGRPVYIMKSARLIKDNDGNPLLGIYNLVDITKLKEADQEISYLRSHVKPIKQLDNLVGKSRAMQHLFTDIQLASQSNVSVLITGESGTGKELAAMAVHNLSPRDKKPFITVNCCSLPETLLESELFGHVKGSFTGAMRDQQGRFEAADEGTAFIDEIGDLSPAIQVKLLRFLQSRTIERIGENKVRKLDVRIIAATNVDLKSQVNNGSFREDLFFRINVFPLHMPPLRDHIDDIPLLVEHFLIKFSHSTGKKIIGINKDALNALKNYHWPGNVRELENAIEHAFVKVKGNRLDIFDLPATITRGNVKNSTANTPKVRSSALDFDTIRNILVENGWHREKSARALGVSRITLWKKMKALGIEPE